MEHKLILGGEQYLPFARSRIKALRATGLKYASNQFVINGVNVRVRIEGQHEYIWIDGIGSSGYLVTPTSSLHPAGQGDPIEARVVVGGPKPKITEEYLFDAYYTSWVGEDNDILLYNTGFACRYLQDPVSRTGGSPVGSGTNYFYLNDEKIDATGSVHGMGYATFGNDKFIIFANNVTDTETRFYTKKNNEAIALVGSATCDAGYAMQNVWMFSPDGKRAVSKRRKLLPDSPPAGSEFRMPLGAPVEVTFAVNGLGNLTLSFTTGAVVGSFVAIDSPATSTVVTDTVAFNEAYDQIRTTTTANGAFGTTLDVEYVMAFEYVNNAPQPLIVRQQTSGTVSSSEISYDGEIPNGTVPTPPPPYTEFGGKASFTNNTTQTSTISVSIGSEVFFTKSITTYQVSAGLAGVGRSSQSGWGSGSAVTLINKMFPGFTHLDARDKSCSGLFLTTGTTSSTVYFASGASGTSSTGPNNKAVTFLKTRYENRENIVGQVENDDGTFNWISGSSGGFVYRPTAFYAPQATSPVVYTDFMMFMSAACFASRKPGEYVFNQRVDVWQQGFTGYGGTGLPSLSPNFYSAASPNSGAYPNLQTYFALGAEAGFGLGNPLIIPQAKKKA